MKMIFVVLFTLFCHYTWSQEDLEAVDAQDTAVVAEEVSGEKNLTGSRPWRAPDYSNQDSALGWSEEAFRTPKGLEKNVKFWIDIYSKYNTDQGVIHDSENIDFIYSVLDFTPISMRADYNAVKKEILRKRMVKKEKERISNLLKKLQKVKNPELLNEEEKKIWDYFSSVNEKNKFLLASGKNRIRFQLGQKDRIIQGIYFSGRYLEDFEKIFREASIPMELTRLVFVESSFNVLARSKVGASGLWQIMPKTGKPYMMINDAIDKRNHPIEAAKTATKLLRTNYRMLESWPLAVTGWNHGPNGILRMTKKYKTRELGEIADITKKKTFGFASKNFYSSFLAILEVEKNAFKYLGNVTWSQPLDSIEIKTPVALTYKELVSWFDGNDLKTQIFNPHINRVVRQGKMKITKGAVLSIPKNKYEEVIASLNSPERSTKVSDRKSNQSKTR
jgi:membrane-bound lytic murein transglycosylase D